MKKIMIVVVGLFLVFGVSGCFENPTAPATVYDPTPTATPEESVTPEETPVETETWKIIIEGDIGTTFNMTYQSYTTGATEILFSGPCTLNGTTVGTWKSTEETLPKVASFEYFGEVTGTIPDSFIVYLYKNGVNIATETVYPHVSPDPNFGCSTN